MAIESSPIVGSAVVDWEAEFSSAIAIHPIDLASDRNPSWYVLRYISGKERLLTRLLGLTKIPFRDPTYQQRHKRKPPTVRRWLPGHMFLEIDLARDYWQQLIRMPAVIEILGGPTPLPVGVMEDLIGRLPTTIGKGAAHARVALGARVRVKDGPIAGTEGAVTWSDARRVRIVAMMFGRPVETEIDAANVEVLPTCP